MMQMLLVLSVGEQYAACRPAEPLAALQSDCYRYQFSVLAPLNQFKEGKHF